MKRLVKTLTAALALTLVLSGCGGNGETKSIDVPTLADEIVVAGSFENELLKMSDKNVADFYNLEQVDAFAVFLEPTGGSAEEVSVFQAKEGQGDTVKKLLEERIETQKAKFENYVPGELFKLENAVICQEGDLLALIVCTDPTSAQEAFDQAVA